MDPSAIQHVNDAWETMVRAHLRPAIPPTPQTGRPRPPATAPPHPHRSNPVESYVKGRYADPSCLGDQQTASHPLPASQIPKRFHLYTAPGDSAPACVFPTDQPSSRQEVLLLEKCFDLMLADLGEPLSLHFGDCVRVLSSCFNEVTRQVMVHCHERGLLMRRIWSTLLELYREKYEEVDRLTAGRIRDGQLVCGCELRNQRLAEAHAKDVQRLQKAIDELRAELLKTKEKHAARISEIRRSTREREDALRQQLHEQVERYVAATDLLERLYSNTRALESSALVQTRTDAKSTGDDSDMTRYDRNVAQVLEFIGLTLDSSHRVDGRERVGIELASAAAANLERLYVLRIEHLQHELDERKRRLEHLETASLEPYRQLGEAIAKLEAKVAADLTDHDAQHQLMELMRLRETQRLDVLEKQSKIEGELPRFGLMLAEAQEQKLKLAANRKLLDSAAFADPSQLISEQVAIYEQLRELRGQHSELESRYVSLRETGRSSGADAEVQTDLSGAAAGNNANASNKSLAELVPSLMASQGGSIKGRSKRRMNKRANRSAGLSSSSSGVPATAKCWSISFAVSTKSTTTIAQRTLRKLIAELYDDKLAAEEIDDVEVRPKGTLAQHVFHYMRMKYGMQRLAEDHLQDLLAAVNKYAGQSVRVRMFGRMLGMFDALSANRQFFYMNLLKAARLSTAGVALEDPDFGIVWIHSARALDVCNNLFAQLPTANRTRFLERFERSCITVRECALDMIADLPMLRNQLGKLGTGASQVTGTVMRTGKKSKTITLSGTQKVLPFDLFVEIVIDESLLTAAHAEQFLEKLFRATDMQMDQWLSFEEFDSLVSFASPDSTPKEVVDMFREAKALAHTHNEDDELKDKVTKSAMIPIGLRFDFAEAWRPIPRRGHFQMDTASNRLKSVVEEWSRHSEPLLHEMAVLQEMEGDRAVLWRRRLEERSRFVEKLLRNRSTDPEVGWLAHLVLLHELSACRKWRQAGNRGGSAALPESSQFIKVQSYAPVRGDDTSSERTMVRWTSGLTAAEGLALALGAGAKPV